MAEVSDPRRSAPACPTKSCRAVAGDPWCYTATGFRRHMHAARWALIEGKPVSERPAGSMAGRRPSHLQADILSWAIADENGQWELSGYTFSGDAQRRAAMLAMSDEPRGWFTKVRETDHGTLYQVTDVGRAAWQRYDDWMNGRTR